MKAEVYSWRVSAEVKAGLEGQARIRKTSVASILDTAVREWLEKNQGAAEDMQVALHAEAEKVLGTISGKNPKRTGQSVPLIRTRLTRQHARSRPN